ncbi:MAG: UDP-N-acetylmuramoyl-tripeptide--D-alanyl-D-alanine ligase [Clostridiales bacterium]
MNNQLLNNFILALLPVLAFTAYLVKRLLRELHMMQLHGYINKRWWHWYQEPLTSKYYARDFLPLLTIPVFLAGYPQIAAVLGAFLYLFLFLIWKKPQEKKALAMTARAKRLYYLSLAVLFCLDLGSLAVFYVYPGCGWLFLILTILTVFPFLPLLFANLLLIPVEKSINMSFYHDAQRIIGEMPSLQVIGITGSFGKTSCKMILGEILNEQYMTLITPASYNTPMGITRVIRESLRPVHEIFVAEMGAKQKGDIEELCQLVKPKIGILTAIGEQHLETFASLENIINTKFELIESLPEDGLAVLNFDNPYIRANAQKAVCPVISYGLEADCDYWAEDIHYDSKGSRFMLRNKQDQSILLQTVLLGKHNIYNILAAVAVAHQLGMSLEKIARAVKKLTPIQHRLCLMPHGGGYHVIDDAFNSNPAGFKAALEVLATFSEGQKIIITPGMVELGSREAQLNKEAAIEAAKVCDYIILVGENHSLPLQEGLKEAAYPQERYYVAADLADARRKLQQIVKIGDIVLFENDLPDTYDEKKKK